MNPKSVAKSLTPCVVETIQRAISKSGDWRLGPQYVEFDTDMARSIVEAAIERGIELYWEARMTTSAAKKDLCTHDVCDCYSHRYK
jgi:hypothetical protein